MDLFHGPPQRLDGGRDLGDGADDGDARGDARPFQMMRHLIPHHIGLLQDLAGKGIYCVGRSLVDDDGERRLDGVGEIADMGAGALDDLAVGVDQGVGLARQRRDLDGKLAFQPFGAAGADVGDRFRNALERRQPETDLEDRGQQQHDTERCEGAAEIIVEGADFIENLRCVAGHADQEFAVGAEVDRPLDDPQTLALGPIDVTETDAGGRQLRADLLELGQLLVPQ